MHSETNKKGLQKDDNLLVGISWEKRTCTVNTEDISMKKTTPIQGYVMKSLSRTGQEVSVW